MVGVTSETATITCNYSKSEEDTEKYLCKGQNPLNCDELIRTTEEDRVVVKDRFHIRDNKRRNYFYVYISDLRRTDSGMYWCGSGKTMTNAEYTKIYLSISKYPIFIFKYIYISVVFHNNTFLLEEKPSAIKLFEVEGIILLFDTWL